LKIRTITGGISLNLPFKDKKFSRIADFLHIAKDEFEKRGFEVQTLRTATQPWENYFENIQQIDEIICKLDELTKTNNLDFFNLGTTYGLKNIPLIYDFIKNSSKGFCTVTLANSKVINFDAIKETAKLIKKLSILSPDGFANLRFAALFNLKSGSPFYPAAYHKGAPSFAIGTENSDLLFKAFQKAGSVQNAQKELRQIFMREVKPIETIAVELSKKYKIKFGGIDLSIAPSVAENESIAFAFEHLGLGKFGEAGTLTIARIVTTTIKNLQIRKCGYSGLMLPVLEDFGLALRNNENKYNISNLLLFSSVCGTGLDTIPLEGDISEKKLEAILCDVASLSIKLNKPLSARLMPIPNKKCGEMTEFDFEYFVNSKIMEL
jgi:uncharacterized protein (UPF0210 family)